MKQYIRIMKDPQIAAAALGIGGGLIDTGINLAMDKERRRRDMKQQRELMEFQQQKQLEMWQKTGYGPQVEQMKKAGINPALMYGMGGGGGQAMGAGLPSVSSQELKGGTGMGIQAALQLGLLKAQKENIEADTANKTKDVEVKGQEISESNKRMEQITQAIQNDQQEFHLLKLERAKREQDNWEQIQTQAARIQMVENTLQEQIKRLEILGNETKISNETIQAEITRKKAEATGVLIANDAAREGIKLTKAQVEQIQNTIEQNWTALGNEWVKLQQNVRGMNQKDQEIAVKAWEAQIKAQYPGLGQVTGRFLNDGIEKVYNWTQGERPKTVR